MGKASMCIQMLQILNTGGVYKISELAEMLETNPRNIIEYKKELEECGYYIDTIPGRYGGYKLDQTVLFPCLKLPNNYKKSLVESLKFIEANNEFPFKDEYLHAMSTILSSISHDYIETSNTAFIDRFPLAMKQEDLAKRYLLIETAIHKSKKLDIEYLSNDNVVRNRTIHPYTLFVYNNAWFVIAWCERACDYRYFKLCRIRNILVSSANFKKNKYYNEHDYINKFGMTKNGDWYEVKLKFTGKAAMYVKDYCYGQNQIIEECDDGTTILSVKMQYKDNIVKFVLNYGNECEVLGPEWLKEDINALLVQMINKTHN